MGDATGDGRGDVLIGAWHEEPPRVYLFDGATGGLLFAFDAPPDPCQCVGLFGYGVAMGDVTGSPLAEVVVTGERRTFVFSGETGGLIYNLVGGSASVAVGDLDGDGHGDVVSGIENEQVGQGTGRVYVFSGATGGLIRTIDNPNFSIGGFGHAVALGEASGDGTLDIVVSALGGDTTSGVVYLFSGSDGALLRTLNPPNPQPPNPPNRLLFGESLAAGDAGGDGRADILVGAPREDVGGNPDQGRAYLFNGANGDLTMTLDSPNAQPGGRFGDGLAMGNVTGDGRLEAAVGAPDEDAGASTDRGRVYLFDLTVTGTSTPTATPTPVTTPTPTPTPTGAPGTLVTFTNNTGSTANDLHFAVTHAGQTFTVSVEQNAPGCSQPTISTGQGGGPDFTIAVNVVWPTSCVDPGESVILRLDCGGCTTLFFWCSDWTIDGNIIGQPCSPTPNCGGVPCCNGLPCPTATASATPGPPTPIATPTPPTGHDARLTRISGVPKNVRLSPGEVIADNANIVVANESNHAETIGVYVDVLAPSGCTPNGRVLQTTVTLGAGNKTTIPVPVSYSCADVNAANGQSYTWTAVADHGADDLTSCGAGSLQSLGCFNALADDDADPADNRMSRTGPKVIAQ